MSQLEELNDWPWTLTADHSGMHADRTLYDLVNVSLNNVNLYDDMNLYRDETL